MKAVEIPYEIKVRQYDAESMARELAMFPAEGASTHVLETRRLRWPDQCPCCRRQEALARHKVECEVPWKVEDDKRFFFRLNWDVPYCSNCLGHVKAASLAGYLTYGIGFLVWLALGLPINSLAGTMGGTVSDYVVILILLLLAAIIGFACYKLSAVVRRMLVKSKMTPSCAHHGFTVRAEGFHADIRPVIRFTFHNDDYAAAFAALNGL